MKNVSRYRKSFKVYLGMEEDITKRGVFKRILCKLGLKKEPELSYVEFKEASVNELYSYLDGIEEAENKEEYQIWYINDFLTRYGHYIDYTMELNYELLVQRIIKDKYFSGYFNLGDEEETGEPTKQKYKTIFDEHGKRYPKAQLEEIFGKRYGMTASKQGYILDLFDHITYKQMNCLLESIIWNENEKSEEGQKKNKEKQLSKIPKTTIKEIDDTFKNIMANKNAEILKNKNK